MDKVPKEIKSTILNYLDDKSRRIARVTCQEWFNIIDYCNFTLYLTKKSEWPQIVDRLSSYSKPISLKLSKNIMNSLEDINEHLLRLTNVTSLYIQNLKSKGRRNAESEWFKLTALSNLQGVAIGDPFYKVPLEPLLHLPKLASLVVQPGQISCADLAQRIRLLTSLERLTFIEMEDPIKINLFEEYQSKMSALMCYVPDVKKRVAEKWFENLGELKILILNITEGDSDDPISLKSLTSLKCLALSGAYFHELNSKHLTYLEVYQAIDETFEEEMINAVNIKQLKINRKLKSYQWLTALTALESLDIVSKQNDILSFVSSKLTSLKLSVKKNPLDLDNLTKFENLKHLQTDQLLDNVSVVGHLTRLESLKMLFAVKDKAIIDTNFVSAMSSLTRLELSHSSAKISHLPHLEHLVLHLQSTCRYTGFVDLPKLTHLELYQTNRQDAFDFSFVSQFTTLKHAHLQLDFPFSYQQLSTLTSLEFLYLVFSGSDFEHLSPMTRLTSLTARGVISETMLQLPTSLQVLKMELSQTDIGSSLVEAALARLPNLYEHFFEAASH